MSRALRSTANTSPLEELPQTRRKRTRSANIGKSRSRSMDDSDMESESSQLIDINETNSQKSPSNNVSEEQIVSNARNLEVENLMTDDNETNPPVQGELRDDNNEDNESEAQRLRERLETLKARSQELSKRKQIQKKKCELADLKKQCDDMARIVANLEAAENTLEIGTGASMECNQINGNNQINGTNDATEFRSDGTSGAPVVPTKPLLEMEKFAEYLMKIQSKPKPISLKREPPVFDGNAEKARIWMKEYDLIAQINRWTELEKAQYLSTALTGAAKDWFDGKFDGEVPDWFEFERDFIKVYKPVGYSQVKKCEFYSLKQEEGEDPINFLDKLLKLRNAIEPKPTDDDVVQCMRLGLDGSYADLVINIEDMDEMRTTLSKAMKNREIRKKLKGSYVKLAVDRPIQTQPVLEKKTRLPTVLPTPAKEFRITCYNCDRQGHVVKNCPEPYDQDKVVQHFANLQHARFPMPSVNHRNSWRPSLETRQQNQRDVLSGVQSWYGNQPALPIQPSQQEESTQVVRHNQFVGLTPTGTEREEQQSTKSWISPLPTMETVISGEKVEALIDTGGATSLISIDLAIKLNLEVEKADYQIQGLCGTPVVPLGKAVRVPVLFNEYVVIMPLTVVADIVPSLILGMDFIRATNLAIFPNSKHMKFQVMKLYSGKSPCSESEPEDDVIREGRPPYPLRHATVGEKEHLNRSFISKVKKRSDEERKIYINRQLKRSNDSNADNVCPTTLMAPTQRPEPQQTTYYAFNVKHSKGTGESDVAKNDKEQQELSEKPIKRVEQIARVAIARVKVRQELETSLPKNMNSVNENRTEVKFDVGDRVLLRMKETKLTKNLIMRPKYSGPYVVLKRINPQVYRLTKAKGTFKSFKVHLKRLKLYRRRDEETEKAIETSSGSNADEEDNRPDTKTKYHWEESKQEPDRTERNAWKPKTLKEFVWYLYRLLN